MIEGQEKLIFVEVPGKFGYVLCFCLTCGPAEIDNL